MNRSKKRVIAIGAVVAAAQLAAPLVANKALKPSTRRMLEAMGWRSLFNGEFLEMYVYGRWTNLLNKLQIDYLYPVLGKLGPRAQEWYAKTWHGKLITYDEASNILRVEEDIPLQDLDQVVPYPYARDIVLNGPLDIAVMDCTAAARRESIPASPSTSACGSASPSWTSCSSIIPPPAASPARRPCASWRRSTPAATSRRRGSEPPSSTASTLSATAASAAAAGWTG